MSIFINKDSKVIVQGITGSEGAKHTQRMLAAGTNIVGGVNARKAGQTVTHEGREIKVYGTVKEAMAETGADVSIAFVPPKFTRDAAVEAIEAEIGLLVVITEGVPVQDSAEFYNLSLKTSVQTASRRPASSAPTAPASSPPASPWWASPPPTSPARAAWASCPSPAP
jgi:succinyl-CoA synthetase alpha subunit